MNPVKWYKGKKQAKSLAEAEAYAELEAKGLDQLKSLTAEMLSKPCPVNRGGNCAKSCVHFYEGWALPRQWRRGDRYVQIQPPVCKLWGVR